MSARNWHFYDSLTGIFSARTLSLPESVTSPDPIPAGHSAIPGTFDHLSQRVDVDKVRPDQQAHLDAHAAIVEVLRKNFVPGHGEEEFHAPPVPPFFANASHVIDYQPPQPTEDHQWNPETKRWALSVAATERAARATAARSRVAALIESQQDLIRRMVLAPDAATREALAALDGEIAQLRASVATGP